MKKIKIICKLALEIGVALGTINTAAQAAETIKTEVTDNIEKYQF